LQWAWAWLSGLLCWQQAISRKRLYRNHEERRLETDVSTIRECGDLRMAGGCRDPVRSGVRIIARLRE
jgi:hypothetical protein